jgi:hypothetical protein
MAFAALFRHAEGGIFFAEGISARCSVPSPFLARNTSIRTSMERSVGYTAMGVYFAGLDFFSRTFVSFYFEFRYMRCGAQRQ